MADNRNNTYMTQKPKTRRTATATRVLRRAIAESGLSFAELERRSGVKRQSLMKFAKGEQSLRLDMADKLMNCLGLEITPYRGR
jgi:transcriptional regulator with XRE-family HTH domain